MSKIYLASSWRNEHQPTFVELLRHHGHEVYDFRNPPNRMGGFGWSQIDENWKQWTADEYRTVLLGSVTCSHGYLADLTGMEWADTFLLVNPCGKSAHLEMGWAAGRGKRTIVLLDGGEPELMYLMCNHICVSIEEVLEILE